MLALQPVGHVGADESGHERATVEPRSAAVRAHPFTAPPTRPLLIRPWTMRKKTMTGTATSVEAAMTWPQSVSRVALACTKPRSHSGSVRDCSSVMHDEGDGELVPRLEERVDAGRDEAGGEQREGDPQEGLGAREAVDHGGLLEVGGNAGDEAAQHPDRERARPRRCRARPSPIAWLSSPSDVIILYCAMNRPSAGSIWISSSASTKDPRPRKRNRLIASAPRKAIAIAATTVVSVTTSEMVRADPNDGSVATARRLSSEPPKGRNVGVADWSTTLGRKAELSIQ